MNSVNQICESIVHQVTTSCLDFNMNQTPYSLHFSIRKKFSKNLTPNRSSLSSADRPAETEYLRQELLCMKNEYTKVFSFYQFEMKERMHLEENVKGKTATIANLKANLKIVTGNDCERRKSASSK